MRPFPHGASGRLDSNQRSPAPEAGGVSRSPTTSQHPRRDSNPRFRVEGPASPPLDHGGMCKSEALESNQALPGISEPCRHGHRPPTKAPAAGLEPAARRVSGDRSTV